MPALRVVRPLDTPEPARIAAPERSLQIQFTKDELAQIIVALHDVLAQPINNSGIWSAEGLREAGALFQRLHPLLEGEKGDLPVWTDEKRRRWRSEMLASLVFLRHQGEWPEVGTAPL
jgi:hypothetical protein